AVKVTVTPLVAVPPVVTLATRGAAYAPLIFAFCPDPLLTATASTGGGGVLELELQLVSRPADAATQIVRMLAEILQFITCPPSGRSSGSCALATAETPESHAGCG